MFYISHYDRRGTLRLVKDTPYTIVTRGLCQNLQRKSTKRDFPHKAKTDMPR